MFPLDVKTAGSHRQKGKDTLNERKQKAQIQWDRWEKKKKNTEREVPLNETTWACRAKVPGWIWIVHF